MMKWVVTIEYHYNASTFVFESIVEAATFMKTAVAHNVPYADKYDHEPYTPTFKLTPLVEAEETIVETEEEEED